MHAPIVATATSRPHRLSVTLALTLHAGVAATLLAPMPPAAPFAEPATLVELVQWSPPPPAVEQPIAAPEPKAAPQPAKVAPPRAAVGAKPAAAPALAAATKAAPAVAPTSAPAPTSPPTSAPAPEPASVPADGNAASPQPAAAGSGPAATAAAGDATVPPSGDATVPPSGDADYLANPKPAYPPLAQKRGWEGVVTLLVAVDETGAPQEVKVKASSGYSLLDRCAVEAVQRWRFTPARRGGKAVAANVEVPIRFGLEGQATG